MKYNISYLHVLLDQLIFIILFCNLSSLAHCNIASETLCYVKCLIIIIGHCDIRKWRFNLELIIWTLYFSLYVHFRIGELTII